LERREYVVKDAIFVGSQGFDSRILIVDCCRYANLRRRLLIDPHLSKDEEGAPDLIVENPLSQSPGRH
jgi:hypothetical protein